MTPRGTHPLVPLACLTLAATLLAGCGTSVQDGDRARADAAGSPVASTSAGTTSAPPASPSAAMTATASASGDTDTVDDADTQDRPSRSAAPRATLPARLLTAGQLPTLRGAGAWSELNTSGREPRALSGTCHRFTLLSVGATRVAHRDYRATGGAGARAQHLVASFADAKTAWRAFEVLKSWHDDCAERLRKWERHDVGPLRPVGGPGEGHSYLLGYGPVNGDASASYFDSEGLVRVGNRVAVLRIAYAGDDYPYPRDQEPIDAAVRAAAAKLM
jgi:hypothetical protein